MIDRFETIRGVGVFSGHLDGDEQASVLIAHQDGNVAARIRGAGGRMFHITYAGDGMHKITEVDSLGLMNALRDDVQALESPSALKSSAAGTPMAPNTATPPVIDVMVLYTTQEKNGLGGQAATEARIALCVAYNNEAFRRSYVNARYRLVHTEEVTESWHVPSQTASTELGWLRSDSMVAQRQSSFGADVVSLLCYITDWGGLADCSALHSVFYHYPEFFTHECGHNVGCGHDRAHGGCGVADYAYGWYFTSPVDGVQYGTIMSYVGSYCDLFSNPTNQFRGAATGVPAGQTDAADNARFINERAATVACWVSQAVTVLSSPALINNGTQFSFQIAGPNSGVYRVEYTSDYLSWSTLGDFTLSSGSVSVTVAVGEAFWSDKANETGFWKRVLWTWP